LAIFGWRQFYSCQDLSRYSRHSKRQTFPRIARSSKFRFKYSSTEPKQIQTGFTSPIFCEHQQTVPEISREIKHRKRRKNILVNRPQLQKHGRLNALQVKRAWNLKTKGKRHFRNKKPPFELNTWKQSLRCSQSFVVKRWNCGKS